MGNIFLKYHQCVMLLFPIQFGPRNDDNLHIFLLQQYLSFSKQNFVSYSSSVSSLNQVHIVRVFENQHRVKNDSWFCIFLKSSKIRLLQGTKKEVSTIILFDPISAYYVQNTCLTTLKVTHLLRFLSAESHKG